MGAQGFEEFSAFGDRSPSAKKTASSRAKKTSAKKSTSRRSKKTSEQKIAKVADLQGAKIPRDEYAADPALNWSTLKRFVSDPRGFRLYQDSTSSAKEFGTLFHAALLEPERFAEKAKTFDPPINPKTEEPFGTTTKAYSEAFVAWSSELPPDALICSERDRATVVEMTASFVESQPFVVDWKSSPFETELPLKTFDKVSGIDLKGRIDFFSDALGIVDVKTTNQPLANWDGSDAFFWTARRFGYLFELAYYAKIVREITGVLPRVSMLVFETVTPYRVGVYRVKPNSVLDSIKRIDEEFIPLWIEKSEKRLYQFDY